MYMPVQNLEQFCSPSCVAFLVGRR